MDLIIDELKADIASGKSIYIYGKKLDGSYKVNDSNLIKCTKNFIKFKDIREQEIICISVDNIIGYKYAL